MASRYSKDKAQVEFFQELNFLSAKYRHIIGNDEADHMQMMHASSQIYSRIKSKEKAKKFIQEAIKEGRESI